MAEQIPADGDLIATVVVHFGVMSFKGEDSRFSMEQSLPCYFLAVQELLSIRTQRTVGRHVPV